MIWRIGFENKGRASGAYVSTRVLDISKKQFFKAEEYTYKGDKL
jgi:hypothetical protein